MSLNGQKPAPVVTARVADGRPDQMTDADRHSRGRRDARPARRWRYTAFVALLAVVGLLASAAPAAANDPAGKYDGYWMSSVSGCGSNIRVGPTKSIYDSKGVYYGWAEQRWSNSGACWGYQWAAYHITKAIPVGKYDDGTLGFVFMAISDDVATKYRSSTRTIRTTSLLGNYNTPILYAPNDKLTGTIFVRPGINDKYWLTSNWTSLYVTWSS